MAEDGCAGVCECTEVFCEFGVRSLFASEVAGGDVPVEELTPNEGGLLVNEGAFAVAVRGLYETARGEAKIRFVGV